MQASNPNILISDYGAFQQEWKTRKTNLSGHWGIFVVSSKIDILDWRNQYGFLGQLRTPRFVFQSYSNQTSQQLLRCLEDLREARFFKGNSYFCVFKVVSVKSKF